ncbi:MAG: pyridoxamine 5'-phosphate oxidase [Persicimonas sp.]
MPETPYDDPFDWFAHWYADVRDAQLANFNAMSLATVDATGQPRTRQVLLKSFDAAGFVFYTNYRSPKARQLEENPRVALNFYWRGLERQIRIEGFADRLSEADSDAYFATRPRGSQVGAWASQQSQPLETRQVLASRVEEFEDKFHDQEVPRPPHWGGYRVVPLRMEFWEAEAYRLHDRWEFVRQSADDGWKVEMLYP